MQKALTVKPQGYQCLLSCPLKEVPGEREETIARSVSSPFAVSAVLSAEDDFELGGEFLDVFVRAGERAAGFLAGCVVMVAIWLIWAML